MPNTLNIKGSMVKIKKIELERLEGETAFPFNASRRCISFEKANQVLLKWATTAPKGGAYDKCRFSIEWEDGKTYQGRYDLVHFSRRTDEGTRRPDLIAHIIGYCEYILSEPHWNNLHESAQDFLDNYLPQRNKAKGAA